MSFKGVSTLRKAALNMMVKMIDDSELGYYRDKFQEIDEDGTGLIKANELTNVLSRGKTKISDKEIQNLIDEIDYHGNHMINYTEFLAATISINNFINEDRL
mmetsp:Transcript_106572/g.147539  ORF Transcript_106572/g.147539 Transcript_106572/m.147539 type:complete len:102 (-) Transcript_106572:251-556(-)